MQGLGQPVYPAVGQGAEPWDSPQYIGPGPHNLPPLGQRPGAVGFIPAIGMPTPTSDGPIAPPPTHITDSFHDAKLAGEQVVAVPNGSSLSVLPEPAYKRNLLGFRNSSATATPNIFIAFGTNATANAFLRLTQNQMVLFDNAVPQDEVFAFADAVGAQLTLVVGNYNPDAP